MSVAMEKIEMENEEKILTRFNSKEHLKAWAVSAMPNTTDSFQQLIRFRK